MLPTCYLKIPLSLAPLWHALRTTFFNLYQQIWSPPYRLYHLHLGLCTSVSHFLLGWSIDRYCFCHLSQKVLAKFWICFHWRLHKLAPWNSPEAIGHGPDFCVSRVVGITLQSSWSIETGSRNLEFTMADTSAICVHSAASVDQKWQWNNSLHSWSKMHPHSLWLQCGSLWCWDRWMVLPIFYHWPDLPCYGE